MKLIHCADVHLDSPMNSRFSAEVAKKRRAELLETFCRIIEFASAEGACAILIAGDLFDSPTYVRKHTKTIVREAVAKHPELQFFYLAGNHDGGTDLYGETDPQPENFHTFGSRWKTYRLGDVAVTASERPNAETLALDPADINIVMMHGNAVETANAAKKDDIPIRAYAGKGIDYIALGHYHSRSSASVDGRCRACYCGCPEGRGFDECGEKGFLLLETTPDRRVEQRFVPFARRTLHEVAVDITGCDGQEDVMRRAKDAVAGISGDDMVKLTVKGAVDPAFSPEYDWIAEKLNDRFYCAELKSETTLLIRPEDYRNDISLKGEFIRRVMNAELPQADKDRIIRNGLRALWGEEIDL